MITDILLQFTIYHFNWVVKFIGVFSFFFSPCLSLCINQIVIVLLQLIGKTYYFCTVFYFISCILTQPIKGKSWKQFRATKCHAMPNWLGDINVIVLRWHTIVNYCLFIQLNSEIHRGFICFFELNFLFVFSLLIDEFQLDFYFPRSVSKIIFFSTQDEGRIFVFSANESLIFFFLNISYIYVKFILPSSQSICIALQLYFLNGLLLWLFTFQLNNEIGGFFHTEFCICFLLTDWWICK